MHLRVFFCLPRVSSGAFHLSSVYLPLVSFTRVLVITIEFIINRVIATPLDLIVPIIGKARECKLESDCAGIQNTTCMADPRDGRTRCLCGDYSAPQNGACNNKYKALRAPCNEDTDCFEGAHCVQPNNSMSGKRCYCQDGYYEESHLVCNGCSSILVFHTSIFLAFLSLLKATVI
nr:uncharacterized protein LOC117218546 isoform X1 [Megalopta genalis]